MAFKSGQQVALLFSQQATGTVSAVRGGRVLVTWNHDKPGVPRVRRSYPEGEAQRILVPPKKNLQPRSSGQPGKR